MSRSVLQVGRQGGLGFRAEVLIEDTHTSIDLFRQGWRSVYVNFPKASVVESLRLQAWIVQEACEVNPSSCSTYSPDIFVFSLHRTIQEILACCTLPPDTVKWRWKQVLR